MNLPVDIVRLIKTFVRHDPKENMKLCLAAIGWDGGSIYRPVPELIDHTGRVQVKNAAISQAKRYTELQHLGVDFSSCDITRIWAREQLEWEYTIELGNLPWEFTGSTILKYQRMLRSQTYGV